MYIIFSLYLSIFESRCRFSLVVFRLTDIFHWLFSGLLTEVSRVSEVILNHFSGAQNPFDKVGVIERNKFNFDISSGDEV